MAEKKIFSLLWKCLLLCLCLSCQSKTKPPLEKPIVLVTIAPYAFLVEEIAKDTVVVETLIPPGMNIHLYDPPPLSVEKSLQASIWFRIDEPVEKKLLPIFKEQNPQQKIVNLQEGLALFSDTDEELSSCKAHLDGADLHTWLSPKYFLQQARRIFETLQKAFPQHAAFYQNNFLELESKLTHLNTNLRHILAPFKGAAILVSHPSLGYFCKEYNLIQLSVECEGKDPRPKDVENILKKLKTYQVRAVFLQQGFNNRGANEIGKRLRLAIYTIDPYSKDYLQNIRQIAGYIAHEYRS